MDEEERTVFLRWNVFSFSYVVDYRFVLSTHQECKSFRLALIGKNQGIKTVGPFT